MVQGNRMPKVRIKTIKTRFESNQYRNSLKQPMPQSNTTTYEENRNLLGSDEIGLNSEPISRHDKPVPKRIRFKISDFLKDHIAETILSIIIAVLMGILSWIASSLINTQKNEAVIYDQIENLRNSLSTFQDNCVTKETLDLKLKLLQSEIKNSSKDEQAKIEQEISDIKNEIKNNRN